MAIPPKNLQPFGGSLQLRKLILPPERPEKRLILISDPPAGHADDLMKMEWVVARWAWENAQSPIFGAPRCGDSSVFHLVFVRRHYRPSTVNRTHVNSSPSSAPLEILVPTPRIESQSMKSSPATTWSMTWKIMSHESAVPHINTLLLLARLIGARFQGRPSRDYLWGSMFAMSRHQSQQTSTRWNVNCNSSRMKIHEEVNFLDLSNTHQISVPPPQYRSYRSLLMPSGIVLSCW